MTSLLALLPLVAVITLLAAGRANLVQAGMVGLVLTVPAVALSLSSATNLGEFLLREAAVGAWIAWPAVAVIFGGLVFHEVVKRTQPALFTAPSVQEPVSYRRLFMICFLLGPFAECATGFGVGSIIALAAIMRMGVSGPSASVFALFAQILVPWGGLAIVTVLGAALVHIPPDELGSRTALLCAPLLVGYLALFWRLCAGRGLAISDHQRVDDVLWLGAMAVGLYVANRCLPVETAGLSVTATLLALRYARDERPSVDELATTLRRAAPYLVLTVCLVTTRAIPPLSTALQRYLILRPSPDLPAFPVLFHVSGWLCLVASGYAVATGVAPAAPAIFAAAGKAARIPCAVTVLFVIIAQWMSGAGISTSMARGWADFAGPFALLATPLFAAVAGFLTGSGVASNGLMLPLQVELAIHAHVDSTWVAAIQNTAGCALTMFSPIRIGMVSAVAGVVGSERLIGLRIAPLGAMVLGTLVGAAALVSF